ncbi:MAG: DUF3102 domain-containing protein [Mogibacterium sp.]|nr:DUF3102 domain-containing protein [Mogibacterium sp.]
MSDSMNAIDVAYQTEVSLESMSTEQLTAEVNVRYKQAESLAAMSATMLADAGRRLIEIKSRIPHGQFEEWCTDNLEFSKSKAEKMMKLSEKMDDENSLFSKTETFTDLRISTVWALLAAPEEVAAEIIETHDVSDMTVRELKEEIQTLKRRVKEEEDKRHEAEMTVFSPYEQEKADMEANIEHMTEELRSYKAAAEELESVKKDLEDAKAKLKKQKEKQKALEAAKDEEVRKGIEESRAEIEKKAREDALTESAAEIAKNTDEIMLLQETVEKLEAEKAKLSNTDLMEFKVLCDQLQDIVGKIKTLIDRTHDKDNALALRMTEVYTQLIAES